MLNEKGAVEHKEGARWVQHSAMSAKRLGAPELRALYVKVHQSAPYNLKAVKVLAAHGQPSHSALIKSQPWETSMRDDSFTLQASRTLQARSHGKKQVSHAEDCPVSSWFCSSPPCASSQITGTGLHLLV